MHKMIINIKKSKIFKKFKFFKYLYELDFFKNKKRNFREKIQNFK